ncbi:Pol polyprotein [Elysia marginata]|uniref:Pol polyprotein n=1 Tax=Elysia marginata TaxID=1093978 RepID=A0AAV4F3N5_9GAST|nr:Pol polyprotein [Elysia marginata]
MTHHCTPKSTDQQSLKDARFVFIRRDGHKGPLQRPYDGPFKSFQQETRHFESWLEDGKRHAGLDGSSVDLHASCDWNASAGGELCSGLCKTSCVRTGLPVG